MPGNKKNRRVGNPKKRASPVDRAGQSILTRATLIARTETQIRNITNNLPLGHPEHAHKVEELFGAIESYLDDMERTGESLVSSRGEAIVLDPTDQEPLPAGLAFRNQHKMFVALAKKRGWGAVPDGLRRLGAKLDADMMLFPSDMTDARTELAWMRAHVVDVTPSEWTAVLNELIAEEDRAAQGETA